MKCDHLWHELVSVGTVSGAWLVVDEATAINATAKCATLKFDDAEKAKPVTPLTLPPAMALPRDQWPLWAKTLALAAKSEDKGLGDVIARTIGPIGGDVYKKWFEKITGKPCGCGERQEMLNAKYPLSI